MLKSGAVDVLLLEPMYAHTEKDVLIRDSADFFSGSPVAIREPIAIEYLASYLSAKGISADTIQQTSGDHQEILSQIERSRPRVLGVSLHSGHMYAEVRTLLNQCTSKFPDLVIVCGGAHATCHPEIVYEEAIDFAIEGEGEESLYELVDFILNGRGELENLPGISYNVSGQLRRNRHRSRIDFSRSPWPTRNKNILKRIKCTPLAYPSTDKQVSAAQIAYSRGCPNRCEFCVSPIVFPGGVIYRNAKDTVDEIEQLQKLYGTNFLFFNDLTFNSNTEKAAALCDELINRMVAINWFAYCDVNISESLVEKMTAAGCSRIGFGVESLSDTILKKYKKSQNLGSISEALRLTDSYGILNRIYLMIGYPDETREMLEETLETMKTLPIDQPRIAFITPFARTSFYHKTKDILSTDDPRRFTGDEPVIDNDNISRVEYIELRNNLTKRFYSSAEYARHVAFKCRRFPHLVDSYRYFFIYLTEKGLLEDTSMVQSRGGSFVSYKQQYIQ